MKLVDWRLDWLGAKPIITIPFMSACWSNCCCMGLLGFEATAADAVDMEIMENI